MNPRYLEIAADPDIIPGVHLYCDEWCDYCPFTRRCLAFRCMESHRVEAGRPRHLSAFASMEEVIQFTRDISAIDGSPTDELDAIAAGGTRAAELSTTDPLAGLAEQYAMRASVFLGRLASIQLPAPAHPTAPSPFDVVLWFHVRISLKVSRAIVGAALTAAGRLERTQDAEGCAKLALIAIDRSRRALLQLPGADDEIAKLLSTLNALDRGVRARFPRAQTFRRPGFDAAAA